MITERVKNRHTCGHLAKSEIFLLETVVYYISFIVEEMMLPYHRLPDNMFIRCIPMIKFRENLQTKTERGGDSLNCFEDYSCLSMYRGNSLTKKRLILIGKLSRKS